MGVWRRRGVPLHHSSVHSRNRLTGEGVLRRICLSYRPTSINQDMWWFSLAKAGSMGAAISSKRPKVSRQSEPRVLESAETKNGGTGPVNAERDIYEIRAPSEVPALAHEQVPTLEVAETSSKWDNNKRVEEARRARVEWLQRLRRECATESSRGRGRNPYGHN